MRLGISYFNEYYNIFWFKKPIDRINRIFYKYLIGKDLQFDKNKKKGLSVWPSPCEFPIE